MNVPDPDDANADVDPYDGRNETLNERLDRNWGEILQELRVTQTGNQILTGFLLTIAFTPRFATLNGFQRHVYLILVMTAVVTTALGLTPVYLHRGLFRRHAKAVLVRTANVLLRIVLGGVAAVLTGTVLLVFDVVVGRTPAVVASSATLILIVGLGFLPRLLRPKDLPVR